MISFILLSSLIHIANLNGTYQFKSFECSNQNIRSEGKEHAQMLANAVMKIANKQIEFERAYSSTCKCTTKVDILEQNQDSLKLKNQGTQCSSSDPDNVKFCDLHYPPTNLEAFVYGLEVGNSQLTFLIDKKAGDPGLFCGSDIAIQKETYIRRN